MTAQENRQRTMDSLLVPTHAVWTVTIQRLVRFDPHLYKSTVPSRSYQSQHGLCGMFCTFTPTSISTCFPFPAPACSAACSAASGVFSVPDATVPSGRPPGPESGDGLPWGLQSTAGCRPC